MDYTRRERIIKLICKKNTNIANKLETEGLSPELLDIYLENENKINKLLKQGIVRRRIVSLKNRESYCYE